MSKNLLFILVLFANTCIGQIFTVSPDKNNILYKGVENPLTIVIQNVSPANVIAKVNHGKLSGKEGRYVYYADTGSTVNIVLYKKINNSEVLLGLYPFRLRQIPDPAVKIAGKFGGNISAVVLKNQSRITSDTEGFYFDRGLPIISFTLSIIRKDHYIVKEIKNIGEEFSQDIKNALSQIEAGDSIIFKDILAKRHDSTITILNPLTFSVTTQ